MFTVHAFTDSSIYWFIQAVVHGFFHVISLASQPPFAHWLMHLTTSTLHGFCILKNIFIGHVLPVVVLYVFRNFHPGTGQAIICLWLFVVFDRVFMIVCCWSVTFISLSSWIPNLRVSVLVLGCFFWPWWVCRPCFHTEDPPKTDKERGSLGRVKIGVATFWPHINWHRYVVSQILPGISWHLIE